MTKNDRPRGAVNADAAMMDVSSWIVARASVDCPDAVREALLALLDGARWANARRDCGRPARIAWPADAENRAALVDAHLAGRPAALTFHAESLNGSSGESSWRESAARVELAALCPDASGRARWMAVDLDAGGDDAHGARGLADPAHAARCIASCADAAGLCDGLLVARSRSGRGRHVWLVLPEPMPLEDAVVGVAALVAGGFRLAQRDVDDCNAPHAFRRADGTIARPGDSGAVELYPRATDRPAYGWALALPTRERIIDPFDDGPLTLAHVPRAPAEAWRRFIAEARARARLSSRRRVNPSNPGCRPSPQRGTFPPRHERPRNHRQPSRDPLARVTTTTRAFIDGRIEPGGRNRSAFAAACNLLGVGVSEREAEALILAGAAACGLPEREARTAFASAVGALRNRGRR